MPKQLVVLCAVLFTLTALCGEETVRLKATADIWLSMATPSEKKSSAGKFSRMKIKSIQEMGIVRFDATPAKGREVVSAKLFLCKAGKDMLRYIRVSTVSQDWVEGKSNKPYGPADGATWMLADNNSNKAWSFPTSHASDVIMGSGNTFTTYAERKEEGKNWISVELTPELVYALVAGNTDGLAIMDGGTIKLFNNFIHSLESRRFAPYIKATLGKPLAGKPAPPKLTVTPGPQRDHLGKGAIKVVIEDAGDVCCWKFKLNGKPVARWRIPLPRAVQQSGREQDHIKTGRPEVSGPIAFYLENLEPAMKHDIEVIAVARGGAESAPVKLSAKSSKGLNKWTALRAFKAPSGSGGTVTAGGKLKVWAAPTVAKIAPDKPRAMFGDMAGDGTSASANAVWNGKQIGLHGCRGEYASYQLVIERTDMNTPVADVKVTPNPIKGPGGATIGNGEIELYKNWYSVNRAGKFQPAYAVPMKSGDAFAIPDPKRQGEVRTKKGKVAFPAQQNQTVVVDVYIPKDAKPGKYTGAVTVEGGGGKTSLPVTLEVYGFQLPDKLSFWPELNAYRVPGGVHDYHRLTHQHRLVYNPWRITPKLTGSGKGRKVDWSKYDQVAGPLLSGEAFKNNRRAGVPTPCMYLPYCDGWPGPLNQQTYLYKGHWPGKGESRDHIINHYMKAPYIGKALTQTYKDSFLTVQKQYIDHFKEKGWNKTQMQCFYGGKNTHRIDWGVKDMWWTTDEPYHWDDWLALQFFCNLWCYGVKTNGGDPKLWVARADISRPNWQGRVLDGILGIQYGGLGSEPNNTRMRWLKQNTGVSINDYGGVNRDHTSNTQTVGMLLNVWLSGGDAHLPWQTNGNAKSLDTNGNVGGAALLVPGKRFGVTVVGDLRLKAMRQAEQIIEYLVLVAKQGKLTREQLAPVVKTALSFKMKRKKGASVDNADAKQGSTVKAWQYSELRRALAELLASN